jgi:signal transduction histidine kinase
LLGLLAALVWLVAPGQFTFTLVPLVGVALVHAVIGLLMFFGRGYPRLTAVGLVLDVLAVALPLLVVPINFQALLALLLLAPIAAMWRSFGWQAALGLGGTVALAMLLAAALGSEQGQPWPTMLAPAVAFVGAALVLVLMQPTSTRGMGFSSNGLGPLGDTVDSQIQQVFTRLSRVLSQETNHQRVLQVLLDLGAQIIWPQKPSAVQGMALIFSPDFPGQLVAVAELRPESSLVNITFNSEGVFHEVLVSGEGVIATPDQPPLNMISGLHGREYVLMPLRTALDIYGLVVFTCEREFGLDHEGDQRPELLQALVNQCSLALQNTLLQNEVRQGRDEKLSSEEESRHKLARDLHDGPIQRVAAIVMQLEFIKALLKRQPDRVVPELEQVQQTARQAAQEMRTLLFTLRPIVLESEGLVAAANQYVQRLRDQERVNIKLESDQVPRFDPKIEEAIFAIVQEAAGNAKKYANGAPITIRLMTEAGFLIAQVEDRGPGFDVNRTKTGYSQRASLGMVNMEERARMIDGRLDIDSAPGRGTTVSLAVPLVRTPVR